MIDTIQRLYTSGDLVPSVTEFNTMTIVQYDIGDQHIKFKLDRDEVFNREINKEVIQYAKRWKGL